MTFGILDINGLFSSIICQPKQSTHRLDREAEK